MFGELDSHDIELLQWGVLIVASLAAAVWDLIRRRIPNALTIPLFVAGLVQAAWLGGLGGFGEALAAGVLLALPFVVLYALAGGGAGDAKLMAGIGAWVGVLQGVVVLAAVALSGLLLALALAAVRKRLRGVLSSIAATAFRGFVAVISGTGLKDAAAPLSAHPALTVPYGLAIFTGVCTAAGAMVLWSA